MTLTDDEAIIKGVKSLGIGLHGNAESLIWRLIHTLETWNQRYHLISRRKGSDAAQEIRKQVLDSIAVLRLGFDKGLRVMDVGSGVGFPGMVLAVARPDLDLLLVDSGEKVSFLAKKLSQELGLGNVEIVNARFPDEIRCLTDIDLFISKAFVSPEIWLRMFSRVAREGARAVVMASAKGELRLEPGLQILHEDIFQLPPQGPVRRNLMVLMQKNS